MTKARRCFEVFNLTLGRLIALIPGGAGALALLIAFEAPDLRGALLPAGIGLGLLLVAAAMLYWRFTFLHILEFMASWGSSK
ncbi:MAG: hypothetical protein AAFY80_08780 [Pseudomonadota bacterium]